MNKTSKYPPPTQDDWLADFADQALAGEVSQIEADADEELLALEETVLRLQRAFPPAALDQAAVKKMQVRFNARVRRENQEVKQPFWKKWFEPQARLQLAMAFTAMALLVVFAVFTPTLIPAGSSTVATALTPMRNTFWIIALAGVLLIILWIIRRK